MRAAFDRCEVTWYNFEAKHTVLHCVFRPSGHCSGRCGNKLPPVKNPIISPRFICSKGFFAGLIFGAAYFRRGLLLEGILRFKMGWALQ